MGHPNTPMTVLGFNIQFILLGIILIRSKLSWLKKTFPLSGYLPFTSKFKITVVFY